MTSAKKEIHLFWFKRDLRMHDNGPLQMWQELSNQNNNGPQGLGVYVVEEGYWSSEKASLAQKNFVLECALEFQENLRKIGGDLLILKANSAKEAFILLSHHFKINKIVSHRETGNRWTFDRDLSVIKLAKSCNIELIEIAQDALVRGARSRVNDHADRYYNFVRSPQHLVPNKLRSADASAAKQSLEKVLIQSEEKSKLENSTCVQPGGESQGIATLVSFLEERCLGRAEGYRKEMSSPLTAPTACSRISPHISWGSISPRAAYQTATQALNSMDHSDRRIKHIQSFLTRLAWRSHFMQKFETLHWMEFRCLNSKSENLHGWDEDAFESWKSGMTGYPFIDACMRSLAQTNWLNFRARAMVVSFASYALNLDWRGFGPYLARTFIDYEPGIHYSQLQMQGGTTLGSPPRIYSPLKQSVEKDPSGEFIRQWVPELKDLPDSLIHLPCDYSRNGYPPSVIDHTRLWSLMRNNAPKSERSSKRNPRTIRKKVPILKRINEDNGSQLELNLTTIGS